MTTVKSQEIACISGYFVHFMMTLMFGGLTAKAASPNLQVKSAIAVDAQTGQILYQKNDQQKLPIASMTKLLSTYIVLNDIKAPSCTGISR